MKKYDIQSEIRLLKAKLEALADTASDISDLKWRVDRLDTIRINLDGLLVQECPDCNHETVHAKHIDDNNTHTVSSIYGSADNPLIAKCIKPSIVVYYVCLSCGGKFTCVDKKILEPYTPNTQNDR